MTTRSPYLGLERKIAADERGGVIHRWQYGRRLLEAKAGRTQLPHGILDDLVSAAAKAGLRISRRELQRRLKLAEVYGSEAKLRQILAQFGTWSALAEAGFPPVENDEDETDAMEEVGLSAEGHEQDPLFEIPGFKPVLKIRGTKVDLAIATVRQAVDYRDMCREMHKSFGRTVEQIESSVDAMLKGSDGDLDANARESWKRGSEEGTS